MKSVLATIGLASAAGLAACSAPLAAGDTAHGGPPYLARVLVELARPSTDGPRIAHAAEAVTGVPVRYVAPTSAYWHALVLDCPSAVVCSTAIDRLRAATATFVAVQRDELKRPSR